VLEAHKVLIRREAEQMWNANDVDLADHLFAEEFVGHFEAGPVRGRRAIKTYISELIEALPDIRMTIEDLFGEGDRVVSRWRATGTHKSEYRGVRPTGRRITIAGITVWRVASGKIIESWSQRDLSELFEQGGA
jgi:steroid delta-isomerase-like uncharacterized protein